MIRIYREQVVTLNCSVQDAVKAFCEKDTTINLIEVCDRCPTQGTIGGNVKPESMRFKFCPKCGRSL